MMESLHLYDLSPEPAQEKSQKDQKDKKDIYNVQCSKYSNFTLIAGKYKYRIDKDLIVKHIPCDSDKLEFKDEKNSVIMDLMNYIYTEPGQEYIPMTFDETIDLLDFSYRHKCPEIISHCKSLLSDKMKKEEEVDKLSEYIHKTEGMIKHDESLKLLTKAFSIKLAVLCVQTIEDKSSYDIDMTSKDDSYVTIKVKRVKK